MVLIAGYAQTPFNRRKDGSGFRDWVRQAFEPALAMADIDPADIDALVVSSESDFYSLQLNPASVIAADLGLVGAACQRVEGGGASGQLAVHAGVTLIRARQAKRVAVVGFEASASTLDAPSMIELLGYSFDAWTEGVTGVTSTALYALSAKLFMVRTGATVEDFAQVSVTNHGNALKNPDAHLPMELTVEEVRTSPMIADPYCRLDCSPLSDGAAVLILAEEDAVPSSRHNASSIVGIGAASDRVRVGDRDDPGIFAAKRLAGKRAYDQAGIAGPENEIGLAELYDSYTGAQLQGIEALGLSTDIVADHRAGRFALDGGLPINTSGGLLGRGAPIGATGVAQTAICAAQLDGRYHPGLQLPNPPRYAVADTHGGIATTCAVTVLQAGQS